MAAPIITPATYFALTGITPFTGDALTSIAGICAAVSDAIAKFIRPYSAFPITLTNHVMDAPADNVLLMPVLPVRSITSLSLRWGANGNPSVFTADDLLTEFTDYYLPISAHDDYSRTGQVYRRGWSTWAYELRYANWRSLSPTVDPNRGAILLSGTFGETSIPDAIAGAASLMTSMLYARRRTGMAVGSASLNGASYSNAAPFTATSALASPDVQDMLRSYTGTMIHVAGD